MNLDFLKGYKTVVGLIGLVVVALLSQYHVLTGDLVASLNTFFQGLVGYGLVMKANRFLEKKK